MREKIKDIVSPKLKPETLEERKSQILQAALTCFARKGYHQTTMDDIVKEAGLSKGGVYWHFGSKKELFLVLFEAMIADTEVAVLNSLETNQSVREKLIDTLRMYSVLATADEFQSIMPLLIDVWAQNRRDPDVNQVTVALYHRFREPLVQLIDAGIAAGEFKSVNAQALANILFALYDGLMVQWMIDESAVDWDAVNDTVVQTWVAGLMAGDK